MVKDRGSHLGTVVNEKPVGGRSPNSEVRLEEGDNVIIVGGWMSPYQFRVSVRRK
jgi:hypothetical protein